MGSCKRKLTVGIYMALYELSACNILEKIRTKNVSVVEVATAFIDRIKKVNPAINAIHQFFPEKILTQARQKDREIASGNILGRLHGLPVTLKDAFYAPGFRGAKGSIHLFSASPTDKSAIAVTRLLQEGAIILGITNVPEFLASYETDNLLNGRTNNPYDASRTPGGSSGGEAAIIAAGGSCVGLASDTGGSLRVPAHYCGVAGIKPTKGLVPTTGNLPADVGGLHNQLSTFGPMARYIEDAELLLSIIAGPDNGDPLTMPVPLRPSEEVQVKKLRVIYFLNNGVITPDADTQAAFTKAIENIKPMVASVHEVQPPEILKQTLRLVWETCFLGGNQGKILSQFFTRIGQHEFSPMYEKFLQFARESSFDNAELHSRIAQMHEYKREMLKLMQQADILLTPVTATPARLHGTTLNHLEEFTYVETFNLAGWPAVSINCGFSSQGLPIGLQIAAKPWQDHVALAFAKEAQDIFGIPEIINL